MRADLVVERDRLDDVEKLPLVFVDALDLDVEQRGGIDAGCPMRSRDQLASRCLLARFTAANFSRNAASSANGSSPARASISSRKPSPIASRMQAGQAGIALHQPAARRDAVGLVVDAAGIELVKVGEDGLLHQLRMQRRDAVDRMRAGEGEVAHAHAALAALVDQRDRGRSAHRRTCCAARASQQLRVDGVDDLHVARQQPLEQRHRPAFQRLGQQRVVGVAEGALA